MDKDSARIVNWLKKQPANAVVEWTTDHMSADRPWSGSMVAVLIPLLDKECGFNWTVTIFSPDDDEAREDIKKYPEVIYNFIVEHDLDVYGVWDPKEYWYINEVAVPKGQMLSQEQESDLEQSVLKHPGREQTRCGAWSVNAVNAALEQWTGKYARRLDLEFKWNPALPESIEIQEARKIYKGIKSGDAPTYDLGDGVQASGEAMDFLLNLDASETTKLVAGIKEKIRKIHDK